MEPKNVRGHNLDKKAFEAIPKISFRPKLEYAWDAGYAVGKFLRGLKEGKILGVHCHGCHRTLVPPRAFCELCFRPIDTWVELGTKGKVLTYSLSYVKWDASRLEEPEIPAVIQLEGASEGVGILHVIKEADPQEIKIGIEVEAVFKAPDERVGAITDIAYFRPVR